MSFITLNYWDIALAALLVAVNAGLSIAMHLGLEKRLVIATARMVVQLTLIGLVLKALFAAGCHQNVAAWVDIQTIVAGQFFGHGFPKFRKPAWRLDVRQPVAQGFYPSLDDVLRCDVMGA